jgi:hypothetical protein
VLCELAASHAESVHGRDGFVWTQDPAWRQEIAPRLLPSLHLTTHTHDLTMNVRRRQVLAPLAAVFLFHNHPLLLASTMLLVRTLAIVAVALLELDGSIDAKVESAFWS